MFIYTRKSFIIITAFILIFLANNAFSQESTGLTLEDCIKIAMENNISVKSAEEKVKLAEQKVNEARASFMPSISGSGTYTYAGKLPEFEIDFSSMFSGMPIGASGAPPGDSMSSGGFSSMGSSGRAFALGKKHTSQVGLSLQQAMFTWGKILNSYKQASLNLESEKQGFESVKQQVIFDTTKAFYGVLLAQELVKVTDMAVKQASAHVKMAQDLVDAGTATNFDLLRAKVQLANIRSQSIKMQNMLKLAKDGLNNTLGMNLNADFSLKGEFVYKPIDVDLDSLFKSAMANRPEIKQIQIQEDMAKKIVNIAKAGNKPNIAFVGNYNYQSSAYKFGDAFESDNWKNTWNVIFTLSMPIFDGLATRARVKQAKSAVKQIELGKEQLLKGITIEVRAAYSKFQEAKELLKAQEETVQQAQESLRIANIMYKNGMITNVELMDAELAFIQAQTNYSNALNDYVVAIASLEKAIGSKLIKD
ncbi:MAG: TolC family protein [bacterium]